MKKVTEERWKNVSDKNLIPIEPLYLVSAPVGLGTQLHLSFHTIFLKLANNVSNNFFITANKNSRREMIDFFRGNNFILWNSS